MLPIRVRLTLWYSVMFATAALLLGVASWCMLQSGLQASTQQELQERIDDIRTQFHHLSLQPNADSAQSRFDSIYRFRDDGKWLQIKGESGEWIFRSSRMAAILAPLSNPSALPAAGLGSQFLQGTRHVRTLSAAIMVNGHAYSVECGASINKQEALLRQFGFDLLILTPLVLIAAVAAGHTMSRKALALVALIAAEARRISEKNLNLRLPVSPADDEIACLATTLNNMLGRIDAGYRSIRDFTANASHELRTPLARLKTEAEIALLKPRTPSEYQDALVHVQQSADEMTRMTEDLLTLARAEAGADPLKLAPVDLSRVVESALVEWKVVTEHRQLDLRTVRRVSPGLQLDRSDLVLGDAPSLSQLLRILLDNACKWTGAGGVITVCVEVQEEHVDLAVEDTGSGIAAEQTKRVSERFYRAQGDRDHRAKGAGLGLSLAAWIAEQHRTAIRLDSTLGAGSRFSILLPRVQPRLLGAGPAMQYARSSGGVRNV